MNSETIFDTDQYYQRRGSWCTQQCDVTESLDPLIGKQIEARFKYKDPALQGILEIK